MVPPDSNLTLYNIETCTITVNITFYSHIKLIAQSHVYLQDAEWKGDCPRIRGLLYLNIHSKI